MKNPRRWLLGIGILISALLAAFFLYTKEPHSVVDDIPLLRGKKPERDDQGELFPNPTTPVAFGYRSRAYNLSEPYEVVRDHVKARLKSYRFHEEAGSKNGGGMCAFSRDKGDRQASVLISQSGNGPTTVLVEERKQRARGKLDEALDKWSR